MNLKSLTSADFKEIIRLLEQKETLSAQIAELDDQLTAYETGAPVKPARGKRGRKAGVRAKAVAGRGRRAPRGAVKAAIVQCVAGAGEAGISVKEIAAKLKLDYNRVFTCFYNTGKKIKAIKKAGPGRYVWTAAGAPPAKAGAATKPAAAKGARAGKLKDSVLALVKGAGKDGISVKEVAAALGLDPQRIYVWFNATGKGVKEIKKIAPARYAWAG
jgi:transposase-like protein